MQALRTMNAAGSGALTRSGPPRAEKTLLQCRASAASMTPPSRTYASKPVAILPHSLLGLQSPGTSPSPLETVKCRPIETPLLSHASVIVDLKRTAAARTSQEWSEWLSKELAKKMVGVTAGDSNAQVQACGVVESNLSHTAAGPHEKEWLEELDVVLMLTARHLKEVGQTASGLVRVVVKSEAKTDLICLSSVAWSSCTAGATEQIMQHFTHAVALLETALASHLSGLPIQGPPAAQLHPAVLGGLEESM